MALRGISVARQVAIAAATASTSGMADAGGAISQLFYWELATADTEIVLFYRWARANGYDPDNDIDGSLRAYIDGTGRASHVRSLDPLYSPNPRIDG